MLVKCVFSFIAGILYEAQATTLQLLKETSDPEQVKSLKEDIKKWGKECLVITNVEERSSPFYRLREIARQAIESVE